MCLCEFMHVCLYVDAVSIRVILWGKGEYIRGKLVLLVHQDKNIGGWAHIACKNDNYWAVCVVVWFTCSAAPWVKILKPVIMHFSIFLKSTMLNLSSLNWAHWTFILPLKLTSFHGIYRQIVEAEDLPTKVWNFWNYN